MPATKIRLTESALNDLEEMREWYRQEGVPEVGDRFVAEIFERIEALRNHPEMGRIVPEFEQPILRELIHDPFRIVYRRDPGLVRIVRVWRSERRLVLPDEREDS